MKYIIASLYFSLFIFQFSWAQLPEGFIRERIVTGLNPTSLAQAPDGRIFITEKNGTILVVRDNNVLDVPLATIEVDESNERGLGHIVFHPDFESNGYFYVHYSVFGQRFNRISRFTAHGDRAVPDSEKIIIELDETGSDMHMGGAMVFGLDGYLYIATGDGGESWRGEDLGSTNGKILRVDENGQPVPDNPWYDLNEGRANTVFASGFRNPFTMTIHPLTGEIYANDVGGFKFEEVNRIEKGGFYGWPTVEGNQKGEILPPEYVDPVFQYGHNNNYCCIVGSAFYYPSQPQFPQTYLGSYFYSDYCTGHIRMLAVDTGIDKGIFIEDGDRVVDLMVTPDGSLYYLERKGLGDGTIEDNTGTLEGTLWKVSYTGAGTPFISVQPESILVSKGELAEFKITASGALPLSYKWFLNNEEVISNNQPDFRIENASISLDSSTVAVVVMNAFGEDFSDTVLLRVTNNHRPEPVILSPSGDIFYNAGNTIYYSGAALDFEDGMIPMHSFSWKIDFHHGIHSHPAMPWTSGFTDGEWSIPSLGETSSDVWYRIYLKVVDSQGLSKIAYRDIFPEIGIIQVSTFPSGLKINLDGSAQDTPFPVEGVIGMSRYLTAEQKQVKGDSIYFFDKWKDGYTENIRRVATSRDEQLFTAIFKSYPLGLGYGLTASYYANADLAGNPILIEIDSLIDHQYFFQSPAASVPPDFFSISWNGYIRAYKSGEYKFRVFADDGVIVEIDNKAIIDEWNPGVYNLTAGRFLQQGRLYPIRIRMFEHEHRAQLSLRWSSPDFDEEVIPSSQLYPANYLSRTFSSGILSVHSISRDKLEVLMESYKDVTLDFAIVSVTGQTFNFEDRFVPVGRNIISFKISDLVPGTYFLTGNGTATREKIAVKFVKLQ